MKNFYFLFISISFFATSFGQETTHKKEALGVSFFLSDFKTAADIRNNGLVHTLNDKSFFKPSTMNPGIAINYLSGISKHIDFIATLAGSFVDYPIEDQPAFNANYFLLEANASVNLKLLTDKYWVVPFIDIGAGASKYQKYGAAYIPTGVGLQINFVDEAFLIINSQYRIPVTENASYHFYHSIGISGNIAPKKVVAPKAVVIPVVLDRDGDGIVDSLDACPDEPGKAALQGCPDRDGDGIADKDDKCPDVAGLAKYNGCPIPDTDGDGINDEEDKCPTVPGVARYQGCPVPDTDGDGVNDEEDKCPNEPGPKDNSGCPVIGIKSYQISFKSSSAVLLPEGKSVLEIVVAYLNLRPNVNVSISGYTDSTGNDKINQPLSEKRAKTVKAYLVSKGIAESRMTTAGYGSADPVADNKTSDGRKKNRRIEIRIQ